MATISLYANKVNEMSSLVKRAKSSVGELKTNLETLQSRMLSIDNTVCNTDDELKLVQASVTLQEDTMTSLGNFESELDDFINDTVTIDNEAATIINKRKDDFYEKYSYLKPECEKTGWEKFKDALKKAGEWCKEHWKLVVTVVLVIAAIVVICVCPAAGVGLIALGAAKGLLAGALIGGIIGGVSSAATGNSFLDGFEDGAFSGALTGALFGGIGGAGELTGQLLGKSCTFIQNYGSVIKNGTTAINVLNFGMAGFDTVALITGIFDPDSKLVQLNRTLHESKIYNGVQLTLGALGAFGSGMVKGIKYDIQNGIAKCFIAGTLISTANGLVAIENIKAGDKVLSTNEITKETEIKTVVETYVRETMKLIHIRVSGEEIVTTEGHPFYVKDIGFVNACDLIVGEELVDISGKVLLVEDIRVEYTPEPVKVYNFQVEDYHTYFVGNLAVWVHNASQNYTKFDCKLSDKALKDISKKWGQKGVQAFEKAMNKGIVGPKGQNGIKMLKPSFGKYTHEIKVLNSQYGDYRVYGYESGTGKLIFDYFGKGLH